jgi:hypothetical protein
MMYAIATSSTITTTYATESSVRECVIRNSSVCPANWPLDLSTGLVSPVGRHAA